MLNGLADDLVDDLIYGEVMKTHNLKAADIKKKWVVVDAADQPLGRIATQIASVLRGKHRPTYTPHLDTGDNVIVVNASKVKLTGNKMLTKNYYRHTGYIGHLRSTTAQEVFEKNPDRLITAAVKGMLPKNKLSSKLMTNLRVFAGEEHNQEAQKPEPIAVRTVK